jgi:hypothetical protein
MKTKNKKKDNIENEKEPTMLINITKRYNNKLLNTPSSPSHTHIFDRLSYKKKT